jgi:hypothetical protein
MKKIIMFIIILTLVILAGGSYSDTGTLMIADSSQAINGEAKILQSWRGDYPVTQLHLLPEKQREQAVGFIGDTKTFEHVWKAFKPGENVPEIDFKTNLVLFVRNIQFYNRISIGKVNVANGMAEVLAMETMSAMPIEDKVAMSLVVVARKGLKGLKTGGEILQFPNTERKK